MSKLKSFVEFLKIFKWLTLSQFREMDHKLLRIAAGIIGLVFWAMLAMYFFEGGIFV